MQRRAFTEANLHSAGVRRSYGGYPGPSETGCLAKLQAPAVPVVQPEKTMPARGGLAAALEVATAMVRSAAPQNCTARVAPLSEGRQQPLRRPSTAGGLPNARRQSGPARPPDKVAVGAPPPPTRQGIVWRSPDPVSEEAKPLNVRRPSSAWGDSVATGQCTQGAKERSPRGGPALPKPRRPSTAGAPPPRVLPGETTPQAEELPNTPPRQRPPPRAQSALRVRAPLQPLKRALSLEPRPTDGEQDGNSTGGLFGHEIDPGAALDPEAGARTAPVPSKTKPSRVVKAAPVKSLPSACFQGRFNIVRYLGRGASASVWEAIHSESPLRVAVKVFDQGSKDKRQAHREMRVLSHIDHPHVLKAHEVMNNSLISELIEGESMRNFALRQPLGRLGESEARKVFLQVLDGVHHCHEHMVVHRDLKLENLLVDRHSGSVKIIDFGFAAEVASRDTLLRTFCGTPSYMAPEIVRGVAYSGFAADMWALGVVLFAILSGRLPFAARTEIQLYAKIRQGLFSFPEFLGEVPRKFIKLVLRLDGTKRPQTGVLRGHPWTLPTTGQRLSSPRDLDPKILEPLKSPVSRAQAVTPALVGGS